MQLELTDAQRAVLHEVLDRVITDLNMEISHTDNPKFREALRERRALLRDVATALADATLPT